MTPLADALRDDGTELALDLEMWAEEDLAGGAHSLEIDAHVAASCIRHKIADLLERYYPEEDE